MRTIKLLLSVVVLLAMVSNTFADNIVVEDFSIAPGETKTISIELNNPNSEYIMVEFWMSFPEGVTIPMDQDGFYMAEGNADRFTRTHTLEVNKQDGFYHFLVFSSRNAALLGNSGELISVAIEAASNAQNGTYTAQIFNQLYNDPDKNEVTPDDVSFNITIEANDDRIYYSETDTSLPSYTAGEKANVTVKRTINAGEWSTICLPFGMTAEQIEDAFPETNVQLADFIGCSEPELDDEEEVMSFSFKFSTNVAEIEPNHPYLIKVDKKVESFEVDGVTLTPSDELSIDLDEIKWKQGGKWYYDYNSFIGTYEAQTVVPEDCLFLNGNNFWYSTGATKMKAFRGYFYSYNVLGDAYKNGANSNVSLSFNDADGILNVKVGDMPTEGTYDLQGRKVVGSLKRGIYIVDGKKMVIK